MRYKKSQLTAFILLGIVLFAVMAFLFYSSGLLAKTQTEREAEKILSDLLRKTALDNYVTSCLDKAAQDGLKLVGEQGGAVYHPQIYGTKYSSFWEINPTLTLSDLFGIPVLPFNQTVMFNAQQSHHFQNTSFGIYANYDYAGHQSYSRATSGPNNPPEYPYPYNLTSIRYDRPFTNPSIPVTPLCVSNGSNAWNLAKILNLTSKEANNTCKNFYGTDSVQYFLQEYISNKTKECVDISMIASMLGYEVLEQNINTKVIFGEEDVGVILTYPLRITVGKGRPITKKIEFKTIIPVRFKKIYFAYRNLVWEESNNVFFDIENAQSSEPYCHHPDSTVIPCLYPGMNITKYKDACMNSSLCDVTHDNYSDIVRITDYNSSLYGEPYIFQFAVENRPPALGWIRQQPPGGEWDIIAMENDSIIINPFGYDPDDDYYSNKLEGRYRYMDTVYIYSGWKETEDAVFDFDCCIEVDPVNGQYSCLQTEGRINCVQPIYGTPPYNWTRSESYKNYLRNASVLNLTKEDTGGHITRVMVCDEEGLCDWQDVRILVMDIPVAVINNTNDYDDINNNATSIEDEYTLDASHSIVAVGGPFTNILWTDDTEVPSILGNILPDDLILEIPLDDFTVRNLTREVFKTVGTHGITLTITAPAGSSTDTADVWVKQCLPHRSPQAIYPFGPEFQGNHTCCEGNPHELYTLPGWGAYSSSTKVCYRKDEYGCYPTGVNPIWEETVAVTEDIPGRLVNANPTPSITYTAALDNYPENDIFQMTFMQQCSGNRGNACSGAITYAYSRYRRCNQKTGAEDESCQGPVRWSTQCGTLSDMSECYNYTPGESFEETFLQSTGPTINGYCNDNELCSHPGAGMYGSGGPQACRAMCYFGNCDFAGACSCEQTCGADLVCDELHVNDECRASQCDAVTRRFAGPSYCNGNCQCPSPVWGMVDGNDYCANCNPCGDTVRNCGEECEGIDFGGLGCTDFGYSGGNLDCLLDCTIDTNYPNCIP